MPPEPPVLKPRELIHALEKAGFRLLRKPKGSHWQFEHHDGRRTTVPMHEGHDIGPGLLHKIMQDTRLDTCNLAELLRQRRDDCARHAN
jgi:predicted RNA binding protein YcfA (HicA-like mRNA interferase family)